MIISLCAAKIGYFLMRCKFSGKKKTPGGEDWLTAVEIGGVDRVNGGRGARDTAEAPP